MAQPSIRLATSSGIPAVLALWTRADAPPSRTDDPGGRAGAVARQALPVAETDDGVIGSLIATFDGWRGNMYRLAVDPSWRRGRVALALVAEGEHWLTERDVDG